jgi:prophage regulatory protein
MTTSTIDPRRRLLTAHEVKILTSLSRATIWRRVRDGQFPPPVSLGGTRIAWPEDAVMMWIEAQMSKGLAH